MTHKALLEIKNLCIYHQNEFLVKNIDLTIKAGHFFSIIGESGSGKSIMANAILGALPKHYRAVFDLFYFEGRNVLESNTFRDNRSKDISIIWQDHNGSLNPSLTIRTHLKEYLLRHQLCSKANLQATLHALLDQVELSIKCLEQYPHELSGGMKQRINIAFSVASKARLIIADESTSALDPITKTTIIKLLRKLVKETQCSVLFITHDLHLAAHISDQIAVMYSGQIVEMGPSNQVLQTPHMPYTQALIQCIPHKYAHELIPIPGTAPPIQAPLTTCRFLDRCQSKQNKCYQPVLIKEVYQDHWSRCVL
jgi:oligopeptide/dipeptide ABC transporter ATP-binding protein